MRVTLYCGSHAHMSSAAIRHSDLGFLPVFGGSRPTAPFQFHRNSILSKILEKSLYAESFFREIRLEDKVALKRMNNMQ
jgi:hypothetical protein